MNHKALLKQFGACSDAQAWYDDRDSESAWRDCEWADWLLWVAAKLSVDSKLIVLAGCDCAETALRYVADGEERPRMAIETARRWARGEATLAEVRAAASAASAAAYAADAAAAAAAHAAAAAAAYAAGAAAGAVYAAADAPVYAAVYAADAPVCAARAAAAWRQCADIVRARIPWDVIESAITRQTGGVKWLKC